VADLNLPERLSRSELLLLLSRIDRRHTSDEIAAELDRQIAHGLPVDADGTIDVLDAVRWNLREWSGS